MSHTEGNDLAVERRNTATASSESANPTLPPNTGDTDIDDLLHKVFNAGQAFERDAMDETPHMFMRIPEAKAAIEQKLAPDTSKVTRFEVIDHSENGTGRDFVKYNIAVNLISVQDDGRTLKIFLTDRAELQATKEKLG